MKNFAGLCFNPCWRDAPTAKPASLGYRKKHSMALNWSLWWPQNRAFKSSGIGGWKAVLLLVKSTAIDGQKQCFCRGKTSAFRDAFESNTTSIWIKLKLHLNQMHYRVWIKLSLHLNQIERQFDSNWEAIRLGLGLNHIGCETQSARDTCLTLAKPSRTKHCQERTARAV